ncbi:STAS domain-containing protein [Streptacidiphilus sp. PAMC 29251]
MTELDINTTHSTTGPVLALTGELDHASAGQLRTAVDALALEAGQTLTFDLTGLAFCDSTGITVIIAARNHARAADITLSHVPPTTVRILRVLGLDQILHVQPQVEPA